MRHETTRGRCKPFKSSLLLCTICCLVSFSFVIILYIPVVVQLFNQTFLSGKEKQKLPKFERTLISERAPWQLDPRGFYDSHLCRCDIWAWLNPSSHGLAHTNFQIKCQIRRESHLPFFKLRVKCLIFFYFYNNLFHPRENISLLADRNKIWPLSYCVGFALDSSILVLHVHAHFVQLMRPAMPFIAGGTEFFP